MDFAEKPALDGLPDNFPDSFWAQLSLKPEVRQERIMRFLSTLRDIDDKEVFQRIAKLSKRAHRSLCQQMFGLEEHRASALDFMLERCDILLKGDDQMARNAILEIHEILTDYRTAAFALYPGVRDLQKKWLRGEGYIAPDEPLLEQHKNATQHYCAGLFYAYGACQAAMVTLGIAMPPSVRAQMTGSGKVEAFYNSMGEVARIRAMDFYPLEEAAALEAAASAPVRPAVYVAKDNGQPIITQKL